MSDLFSEFIIDLFIYIFLFRKRKKKVHFSKSNSFKQFSVDFVASNL